MNSRASSTCAETYHYIVTHNAHVTPHTACSIGRTAATPNWETIRIPVGVTLHAIEAVGTCVTQFVVDTARVIRDTRIHCMQCPLSPSERKTRPGSYLFIFVRVSCSHFPPRGHVFGYYV